MDPRPPVHALDPSWAIVLRADGRVAYRSGREILELAAPAEIQAVGLQTSHLSRHDLDIQGGGALYAE